MQLEQHGHLTCVNLLSHRICHVLVLIIKLSSYFSDCCDRLHIINMHIYTNIHIYNTFQCLLLFSELFFPTCIAVSCSKICNTATK